MPVQLRNFDDRGAGAAFDLALVSARVGWSEWA